MKKIINHSKTGTRQWKWHKKKIKHIKDDMVSELCDDCKVLGYCKLSKLDNIKNSSVFKIDIKEYINRVPLRIEGSRYGNYSKLHLQTALDAFHQEDYETAILHLRAVVEGAEHLDEAFYTLTLSYFMLKDYDNAMSFAERCRSNLGALQNEIVRRYNKDIASKQLEIEVQKNIDAKEMPTDNLNRVRERVLQTV